MKILLLLSFIIIALTLISPVTAAKCRVLAASGDRIAFEIGLLEVLAKSGEQYDVVTGISAGSLVAGVLSRYPVGQEHQAVEELKSVIFALNGRTDILADWPGGIVDGLFQHTGIFDSSPLKALIEKTLANRPHTNREMRVGAVSLGDAKMDVYYQNSTNLHAGILASCSVPGIFPAVTIAAPYIGTRVCVDGGTKRNVMVEQGIQACLAKGFKQTEIVVDTLLCYNEDFEDLNDLAKYNSIDVMMRGSAIKKFHGTVDNFRTLLEQYPDVNLRWIFEPQVDFPSVGLNFKPEEMKFMYEHGLSNAASVMKQYPNGNGLQKIRDLIKRTTDNYMP